MSLRTARGLACALVAALGLAAISAPSYATSVMPLTVVDLLAHSQTIVAGQVQSVTDGFDARGLPYTEVTIKVADTIRGQKAETYTFRQFGLDKPRKLANAAHTSPARPAGRHGARTKPPSCSSTPRHVRPACRPRSAWAMGSSASPTAVAMNGYDNAGLFSGVQANRGLLTTAEQAMLETKKGPVDADTLRRFLHRAVDGNWVKKGSIANAKH